jgi:putative thymidine phosphorylase
MKFQTKKISICTGETLVAILNRRDSIEFSLHIGDRVRIFDSNNSVVAVVDVTDSFEMVSKGEIGLTDEVVTLLGGIEKVVDVVPEKKPKSIDLIKKKLEGRKLNYDDYLEILKDIRDNKITSIETTYFVAATYMHPLDMNEIVSFTKAMVNTGDILKFDSTIVVDKHCIGGIPGNRTTMLIVPIVAAAGLLIPKSSSRSITSPAGTADTVEVLCDVTFDLEKINSIMKQVNACLIWGGSLNLAPADNRIIQVEKPIAIDVEAQLLASIMAKKKSVSATHLIIDIPYGYGAKIETRRRALHLKESFEILGKKLDMKVKVILTDGSQPIGNGIGPALEARDVLYVLKNDVKAPLDLENKSLMLAGELLELAGKVPAGEGKMLAEDMLYSGKAYAKFIEILKAQNGKYFSAEEVPIGAFSFDVVSDKEGKIKAIDNKIIAKIGMFLGAPLDKGAGLYLYKHKGDSVKKGNVLYKVYAESKPKLDCTLEFVKQNNGYLIK